MEYEEHLAIAGDALIIRPVKKVKQIYGKASVEILLTNDMVDVAKSSGISNDEYASQYLILKLKEFSRLREILNMTEIKALKEDVR